MLGTPALGCGLLKWRKRKMIQKRQKRRTPLYSASPQDHIEAHQNLAFLHLSTGRYDTAQAEISVARKVAPNNLRIIYLQALLDFRKANYVAARDNLLTVLKDAPDDMPSILLSGLVFHELGSFQQAIQNLTKVLDRLPDNVYARKGLAATLHENRTTRSRIGHLKTPAHSGRPRSERLDDGKPSVTSGGRTRESA